MSEPTAGRVALVTGGSRGIGAQIVTQLDQAGFRVATLDRTACARPGVLALCGSVTSADDVAAAFARIEHDLGPVAVVVANAGITRDALVARMGEPTWDEVLDVDLTGAYRVAHAAVRGMLRQGWGRLVFIGSVVGLAGGAGQANYAAAKAGLVGLARSLARELGGRGITSNVVAPGYIATQMTAAVDESARAAWLAKIPLGRPGDPSDVAAVVRFLCGPDAGYITGAVIPVDGGLAMAA
ncbi:MAG: 3-oxoacyl-ACP reductase FabG [Propionibacteriaceae bacterium]|nr:3-oxoacyl-ACP reductase FabG [Propionibacteriaceae bacterium]